MSLDALKLSNQLCFPIYSLSKVSLTTIAPAKSLGFDLPTVPCHVGAMGKSPQTVGTLGDFLDLDTGTLTPLLKRLEAKGFVHRERATQDERVVQISLTAKGDALKLQAATIPSAMLAAMQLDDEAIDLLQQVAQKLCPTHTKECTHNLSPKNP